MNVRNKKKRKRDFDKNRKKISRFKIQFEEEDITRRDDAFFQL